VLLEYKLITECAKLLEYKESIFGLFKHCFEKEIQHQVWQWMYIENSENCPVVSLCQLVGHYGALQIPVLVKGKKRKALLSVGSMVHASYRKYGVFVNQGERVYDYAKNKFICVFGFPNKKALPSRKKRLSWNISETDYVALVTPQELADSSEFNEYLQDKKHIEVDLSDEVYFRWRTSKPDAQYVQSESLIYKCHNRYKDIVYISDGYIDSLESDAQYYVLCDGSISDLRDNKEFDYPFGYRIFDDECKEFVIKKDLIMSDIF